MICSLRWHCFLKHSLRGCTFIDLILPLVSYSFRIQVLITCTGCQRMSRVLRVSLNDAVSPNHFYAVVPSMSRSPAKSTAVKHLPPIANYALLDRLSVDVGYTLILLSRYLDTFTLSRDFWLKQFWGYFHRWTYSCSQICLPTTVPSLYLHSCMCARRLTD